MMFTLQDLIDTIPSETYIYLNDWRDNSVLHVGYVEEIPRSVFDDYGEIKLVGCEAKADVESGAALVILVD